MASMDRRAAPVRRVIVAALLDEKGNVERWLQRPELVRLATSAVRVRWAIGALALALGAFGVGLVVGGAS
jgi:hypothetical protein